MKLDVPLLDATRAYSAFLDAGREFADKEAAAQLLEETKKSVLAKLKLASLQTSDVARETEALAHRDYLKHIDLMVEARMVATKAKVKWEAIRLLCEMRRSEESSRRAELAFVRSGGGGT